MTRDSAPTADGEPDLLRPIEEWRCHQLLEAVPYGRLATVDAGEPLLFVVNHVLEQGAIFIRTRPDSRLARLTANGRATRALFEADSAFPSGRSGWSVIAHGWLKREYRNPRAAVVRSRLSAWAGDERDVVVHLEIERLTGRSVGAP